MIPTLQRIEKNLNGALAQLDKPNIEPSKIITFHEYIEFVHEILDTESSELVAELPHPARNCKETQNHIVALLKIVKLLRQNLQKNLQKMASRL